MDGKQIFRQYFESLKAFNQLDKNWKRILKKTGWKFEDYYVEKKYKGYFISIEFCIGDYCTGLYSKKGKWLLESKFGCRDFTEAYLRALIYEAKIDAGQIWIGEDD